MQGPREVNLLKYCQESFVEFLCVNSQEQALASLVEKVPYLHTGSEKSHFFEALLQREKLLSTGIGFGVAVPHAQLVDFHAFFIIVGIQKGEGIEWGALDSLPVHLIFLIGGPESAQTEYLAILAALTSVIQEEKKRVALMSAHSARDVLQVLQQNECLGG